MLRFIKTIHTLIWIVMTVSNFLAFYLAFLGNFSAWFWIPFSLLLLESIIIVLNKGRCPITPIAEKYTENRQANFDIYLPLWLAKYNIQIFTALIFIEAITVLVKRSL